MSISTVLFLLPIFVIRTILICFIHENSWKPLTISDWNPRCHHVLVIDSLHFVNVMLSNQDVKMIVKSVQQSDYLQTQLAIIWKAMHSVCEKPEQVWVFTSNGVLSFVSSLNPLMVQNITVAASNDSDIFCKNIESQLWDKIWFCHINDYIFYIRTVLTSPFFNAMATFFGSSLSSRRSARFCSLPISTTFLVMASINVWNPF